MKRLTRRQYEKGMRQYRANVARITSPTTDGPSAHEVAKRQPRRPLHPESRIMQGYWTATMGRGR